MRHYDIAVQVRTAPEVTGGVEAGQPPPPAQFLWHDRLYVVREVLGLWRERTAWWAGAVGQGVHGDGATQASAGTASGGELEQRWDAADRWVWRVEASAGRSGVTGTYDICREGPICRQEPASGPDGAGGDDEATWRLVRVCD